MQRFGSPALSSLELLPGASRPDPCQFLPGDDAGLLLIINCHADRGKNQSTTII